MEQIQYTGLELLDMSEKRVLNKLSAEYYDKIKEALNNETSITIHIKAHDAEGKRKRWDITAKAVAPTKIFESKTEDWDLAKTLHKVFEDLETQIKHKLKVDDQKPKHQIGKKTTIRKAK